MLRTPSLLLLLACDPTPSSSPSTAAQDANEPGVMYPGQGEPSFDQTYLDMMVPHHQGAVEMAKLAQTRAEHAQVRTLAVAIIASQEAEIADMQRWRKQWFGSSETPKMNMPLPQEDMPGRESMTNMSRDMELLKTADPFDLAFLDAMIAHHQGAIEMGQAAATQAVRAEIRMLSTNIVSDQRDEIAQMQVWRKEWYPDAPAAITPG